MKQKQKTRKPTRFQTLVVGADFTPQSKKVFEVAKDLAHQWAADLVLVHVSVLANVTEAQIFMTDDIEQEQVERLRKKLNRFYKISPKDRVKTFVHFGSPAGDLIATAKKCKKPLIMVGHTKKGPLSRFALGSVSRTLALNSPVPLWIQ